MKKIKIKYCNGITSDIAKSEILNELLDIYEFIEDDLNPEFIIFGPYGNDIPVKSNKYTRIGYFCENIKPDFSICEWAFGIPREEKINNPNYSRIQWHGLNATCLIKQLNDKDIDQILSQKNKFCNFLYSNCVPYREEFFRQLSKYKKIDAPGKSMNNTQSIDTLYKGNTWERKRNFLSEYKFTIAFENYSYPGYQTEKLYDAMQVNSLPIYCGDLYINEIFNTKSFLNAPEYIKIKYSTLVKNIEDISQPSFKDYRPSFYKSITNNIQRKLKKIGREIKMEMQFNKLDFSNLIDRIIEIDKNPELYIKYLNEPWFNNNRVPDHSLNKKRWIQIFNNTP